MMHAEPSEAEETRDIELPPALLAALKPKNGVQVKDLHVESWKPSLLGRFAELLVQKRR
jgi:hypothetical protein